MEKNNGSNIFERLRLGESVSFFDPDYHLINEACTRTREVMHRVNQEHDTAVIRGLLSSVFKQVIPATSVIIPPFHLNYGGNTQLGEHVFINYDCSVLDLCGDVIIEEGVMIAPRVSLSTEGHPTAPQRRQELVGAGITIRKNAWIGLGAIILPGVTVGENSVVAAGAVLSKNVAPNTVVGGVPARVLANL